MLGQRPLGGCTEDRRRNHAVRLTFLFPNEFIEQLLRNLFIPHPQLANPIPRRSIFLVLDRPESRDEELAVAATLATKETRVHRCSPFLNGTCGARRKRLRSLYVPSRQGQNQRTTHFRRQPTDRRASARWRETRGERKLLTVI